MGRDLCIKQKFVEKDIWNKFLNNELYLNWYDIAFYTEEELKDIYLNLEELTEFDEDKFYEWMEVDGCFYDYQYFKDDFRHPIQFERLLIGDKFLITIAVYF